MTLRGEVLNLSGIKDTIKSELLSLFERLDSDAQSSKVVYAASQLLSTLDEIGCLEPSFLKEHGILGVFPYAEESEFLSAQNAVFLVYPDVEKLRSLVVRLLAYTQNNSKIMLHVFFVPQKPLIVEHILENEYQLLRCLPNLRLGEFDLDIVPLANDFFSMQQSLAFKHLFADGDISLLQCIARMLLKLQTSHFGMIPLIRGKGIRAVKVINMLDQMQREVGSEFMMDLTSEIDSLFILDRSLDLVTPLMSQLTYEGLIDEIYGIDSCFTTFPFCFDNGSKPDSNQRIRLNDNDRIFAEIRDKNFTNVGSILHSKSVLVKQSYERRKEVQQLKELKEFMKGLPEMQEMHRLIAIHTTIATEIGKRIQNIEFRKRIVMEQNIIQQMNDREVIDYIEELINTNTSITHVLRLISMFSLVNGGLKGKTYDFFKENIMLSYGIPQGLAAFFSLERAGLITKHDGKQPSFSTIRKSFKLWNDTLPEQQSNDTLYTYSGYAPLSARLLEFMITHPESWNTSADATDLVSSEKAEIRNEVEVRGSTPITMVFVIGGITYAEISALRHLQKKTTESDNTRRILIASTNIINGENMIDSLLPFLTDKQIDLDKSITTK